MEDAKVLSGKARAAGFYGLLTLALLTAVGTAKLSFDPPILKSAKVEAEIAASLAKGESYSQPADVRWAKALSLALAGVSLASGFSAVHLSSARPQTLTTPLLDDVANPVTPTTLSSLSDDAHQSQGELITDKLTALLDEYPWLDEVVDIDGSLMDVLIIIGQPGKGKSCLASAIGLLRKIMHTCPLYIFDADADKNVRGHTWVSGTIAGMTEAAWGKAAGDCGHLSYKAQHARMQATVVNELNSGQESTVTVIYDEEQRLSQNGFEATDIQQHYEAYTAYRKRGDKVIHLWHAATRSGSGLDKLPKDSALLTELLNYAAVIDFNAVPEVPKGRRHRSKEKNSDRAMYKPAGAKYSREHMELITLPKLLHPQTLMEHLGSAAEYFDVRLSGYRDPGLAERRASIRDKVSRKLKGTDPDGNGHFKSALEKVFATPLAQHYLAHRGDDDSTDFENGLSLDGLPDRALFIALLKYLEHPAREGWADAEGFYPIRRICTNWALSKTKDGKRFGSKAAFLDFLSAYNAEGLGFWRDDAQTGWRGRYRAADFG